MTIDNQSPPGSWQREWDARSHHESEYRAEIRELRARIRAYVGEIARLQEELERERVRSASWNIEP